MAGHTAALPARSRTVTLNALIERLQSYREGLGGDAEVRLMTQRSWPFQNAISGVVSRQAINEADEQTKAADDGDRIFIVEGTQLGYGWKCALEITD